MDGLPVLSKPYGIKAGTERKICFELDLYEEGVHEVTIEDLPAIKVMVGSSPDTLEYFEIMGNKPTKD